MLFHKNELIGSRYIAESITAGHFALVGLRHMCTNSCLSTGGENVVGK